jgi:hypothetical protein
MTPRLEGKERVVPVRHIVLAATSVVVLGALVLLLVEVRASPQVEIPEAALAEARARYQRSQSTAERAPISPDIPTPARRMPPRPPVANQPDPAAPVPEMSAPPDDIDPSAAAAVERMDRLREREEMRPEIRERRERLRQFYDEGNYEMALREARSLLPEAPTNRYVMRVAVTSACALGEKDVAQDYYGQLFRDEDRRIVRVRCSRYGVDF